MNSSDAISRLAHLLVPGSVFRDYGGFVSMLQQVAYPMEDSKAEWERAEHRAWTWQTCNEFGYFQSTGRGNSVFSNLVPINFFVNLCTDVYGPDYNITYVQAAVDRTRKLYGGRDNYRGTNVVIPNGSLDPWHALGFYGPFRPLDESAVVYLINGTAHCGDWFPWEQGSPDGLKEVQEIIQDNIKRWLSHDIINGTSHEDDAAGTDAVGAIAFNEAHRDTHLVDGTLTDDEHTALERFSLLDGLRAIRPKTHQVAANETSVVEGWIRQDLDHFNASNFDTWKQRFFVNEEHYVRGGPLFLWIYGEGPVEEEVITFENAYQQYVKDHNAALYVLEHRYYGQSIPTRLNDASDFSWLSVEQALADAAVFVESMNRYKGFDNPKWIALGGSYAEYLQVVEKDLFDNSSACGQAVNEKVAEVFALLQSDTGRGVLQQILGVNTSDAENVDDFLEFDVASPFMGAAQFGFIGNVCAVVTNTSNSHLENLKQLASGPHARASDIITLFTGPKRLHRAVAQANAWEWQKCNEFGYFKTTDTGRGIFGGIVPINRKVERCAKLFGEAYTRQFIDEAAARTLRIYGGSTAFNGTNVAFVNGELDPWHALSLYTHGQQRSNNGTVTSILLPGLAHCPDVLNPPNTTTELHDTNRFDRENAYPLDMQLCSSANHFGAALMRPFEPWRNTDGLNNKYTDNMYSYAPRPTCAMGPNCGSKYLFCDRSHGAPRCAAKIRVGGSCAGFVGGEDMCDNGQCLGGRCVAGRPKPPRPKPPPRPAPRPAVETCYNEHECCGSWAQKGECRRNGQYMNAWCKASCGVCRPTHYQLAVECNDRHPKCAAWSRTGECNNNPYWMTENCRKACGKCQVSRAQVCGGGGRQPSRPVQPKVEKCDSPGCFNENVCCQIWGLQGQCSKRGRAAWMSCNCRVSCGLCIPTDYMYGVCGDYHRDCPAWARLGECSKNPWTLENCRFSCGTCLSAFELQQLCRTGAQPRPRPRGRRSNGHSDFWDINEDVLTRWTRDANMTIATGMPAPITPDTM
ncbi:ShTK domain-containing protein [Aphelenchoides avenae]|nr:ShTK domain-containing protein [Aphelenchus avenae]